MCFLSFLTECLEAESPALPIVYVVQAAFATPHGSQLNAGHMTDLVKSLGKSPEFSSRNVSHDQREAPCFKCLRLLASDVFDKGP